MPELPEVELVKRELTPVINLKITDVELSQYIYNGHKTNKRTIVKDNLEAFKTLVAGKMIMHIGRRGKYLYFLLGDEYETTHLVSHLGMSGAYFIVSDFEDIKEHNFKKHWQVIFSLDNGQKLIYSDIRRFGEMHTHESLHDFPPFARMAPEYTDELSLDHYMTMMRAKKYENKPVKAAIMDGEVIPGVGNIYAVESLYLSHILPTRKVKNISDKRLHELFDRITEVFELSLSRGGSTISDYRSVTGGKGEMQNSFNVYQRKTCPLGHPLKTKVINTRNTFYCTTCQR
ncbi:bifunctional DNA-formamidopyrimidine glycosylase/DNA-(apurinic or apyrimidinic site) lyase [Jeotgalicoccus nanhaiensis]|uniref:Bifunctional DNA-formamidopyrimidine glycosylase/DNA-(Apurinic or apyrimidinic site) lyase n=1 Tax=Jeotgalicoccus nanhaiensis TaxID=568603 RepID=A0ABR9XYT3_9STAP|nr:bifunctional DNA-formamidopyrimidine glycosylase/DNA-(apurinic or apyrimidinic site) lyase [Jeotgalicoccus nanhaiensis]MBF0754037.1 bifunctional DNA-formamidopyrimidine glycosylase/DNA-(apurinic or apyrimidinic site) lyase [Jeotgalicoccus nanhaiensis]TFU61523.1 bifunctional DNA-formamidopyrimidine glycosylase/DNA-(apurinic or apyrimidinic site) lyase [Jeotgalicoccus nanhaiensis]